MIEVKKLDKHFNKGKKNKIHVLNEVSLQFPEKGLVVLLGASGSGKTTLLNVIGGLDKVDKGEIDFYDKKITKYRASVWDKIRTEEVGFIFQNYYLKNELSVFDNVAFVLKLIGISDKQAIEERVHYILNQVGMFKYRKKLASQLSGGQQQRVAIARALVKNPKVIIADEPTGNLDSKNTLDVMNIIKTISLKKLVILVTHEKDIADFYGDRIIKIKDGKVEDDYLNTNDQDHNFTSDNTIYLKDLHNHAKLSDKNLKVDFYSESDEVEPTEVKLIIKNKTLYIDIKGGLQKIKLNDASLKLDIKDEHYKKKSREEILETSFDLDKLDHTELSKKSKLAVSFKTSLWIAFKKFLNLGKKGKLMLFLFMLSGFMLAYSVTSNYTVLTKNADTLITYSENTISATNSSSNSANIYNLTNTYTNGNFDFVLSGDARRFSLTVTNAGSFNIQVGGIEHINQISESKLVHGRMPSNDNEIVISKGVYKQNTFNDTNFTVVGIWSLEEMLNENIIVAGINGLVYKIVGITNEHKRTLYANSYVQLDSFYTAQFDQTITKEKFFNRFIRNDSQTMISTSNPKGLANHLNTNGIHTIETITEVNENLQNEKNRSLINSLPLTIIFVGAVLVVFYFVMRSSMISRIYEIAVNRALGVSKMNVMLSFLIEIVFIVTVSTFIGYNLLTFILASINNTSFIGFISFKVDFLSYFIGFLLVYGLNLIVGLFPLFTLLLKTPSQIISTYDM